LFMEFLLVCAAEHPQLSGGTTTVDGVFFPATPSI
jgi:hypothetical protein